MKFKIIIKSLCLLLLCAAVMIAVFGCGEDTPTPPDTGDTPPADGTDENEGKLALVKDGVVNFTFVYTRSDSKVRKIADRI